MRRRILLAAAVAGGLVFAGGGSATAADLTGGCSGTGTSIDASGNVLQEVEAPSSQVGTEGNPILVDFDGQFEYEGQGPVMRDHDWEVRVFGIPVRSDGDPNQRGVNSTKGDIEVGDFLPFEFTGLYWVDGEISGTGGSCSGSGWVKLVGSPLFTLPFFVGSALTIGGGALLFFATPTAPPAPAPTSAGGGFGG